MTDLECPRCGGDLRDLTCADCGARYERVFGVPFIGDYEPDDALGLIEIAANVPFRDTLAFSPEAVETIDALNSAYHAAADKDAFVRANPEAQAPYFPFRYAQWLEAQNIIGPVALEGRKILDIGAGAGFDSYRLAARGAEVTALEINPLIAEAGQKGFPSFRWIGGFSHALPFKSGSFDGVFFNAALHHMRDIPASISEALRVLRPGGQLVTTADSFRADHQTIDLEYQIFDKNPDVLLGVNEQIPPFSDFVSILEQNRELLEVELFTTHLYGQPDDPTLRQWDLTKDAEALRRRSGALAMRIKLLKPWPHRRHIQANGALTPKTYAAWLDDQSGAVARIASIVPAEHINLPFPGRQTKFSLLNGWRSPEPKSKIRSGYRRARWFLTRRGAERLTFSLRSSELATFTILVNGNAAERLKVGSAWVAVSLGLSWLDPVAPFVVEIRREGDGADFDAMCFDACNRQWHRRLLGPLNWSFRA